MVLEWGVTPVASVLSTAGLAHVDIVLASDLAAPITVLPQLLSTLSEVWALCGATPPQMWIACHSHREFTPALLAALPAAGYTVTHIPDTELDPKYLSPSRRLSLYIVNKPCTAGE